MPEGPTLSRSPVPRQALTSLGGANPDGPLVLTLPPVQPTPASMAATRTCFHCGGSGVLRLGGHRFRTCLECLGQGELPDRLSAGFTAS